MRFLRHLGAAAAVVAIVVVLGLAWAHYGSQTLAPGPQIGFRQEIVTGPGGKLPPGMSAGHGGKPGPGVIRVGPKGPTVVDSRPFDLGLGSMFNPVNLPYLRHTVVIEVGVIAAVVVVDVLRRRSRRAWRTQQLAAEAYRPDDEG
ncbi:MAG TPA: hypothetical protein VHU92_03880 [Streptosporangiaceae bacterium]|jgi:hypothetical protein|nr:hypothetical protein [Streptosporangiaceae bacterium]